MPEDWKTANIFAIYKKCNKKDPANYRHVSLVMSQSNGTRFMLQYSQTS